MQTLLTDAIRLTMFRCTTFRYWNAFFETQKPIKTIGIIINMNRHTPNASESLTELYLEQDVRQRILDVITSLRYGSVEVTIHDGRVVQIDRKERIRLGANQRK